MMCEIPVPFFDCPDISANQVEDTIALFSNMSADEAESPVSDDGQMVATANADLSCLVVFLCISRKVFSVRDLVVVIRIAGNN